MAATKVALKSKTAIHRSARAFTRTILLSSEKRAIVAAFAGLRCIVTSECVCQFCDGTKGIDFVYEFGRCLVPTRIMQLIKARHHGSDRWTSVQPLYAQLYATLYDDLDPRKGVFSNGALEDQACDYSAPASISAQTLSKIKAEKAQRQRRRRL